VLDFAVFDECYVAYRFFTQAKASFTCTILKEFLFTRSLSQTGFPDGLVVSDSIDEHIVFLDTIWHVGHTISLMGNESGCFVFSESI